MYFYENVTQVLYVRPPKSTSKTTALRRLYKKNASKCGLNQTFFLALCAELETYLYPKNHEGEAQRLSSPSLVPM